MRAPQFWWQASPTLWAKILSPLGEIYGAITAKRMARSHDDAVKKSRQYVICIGNFTAGGAGKTPVAIALAELLQKAHRSVCFLSRGYGGTISTPVLVDLNHHSAAQVGDEPLLLARIAPTIIARNRAAGLELCEATGTEIIIMDDGLQNPSIAKNMSFAVVDNEVGIGNGLCIPAGPLRAPLVKQWSYVDAMIIVGTGAATHELENQAKQLRIPVFKVQLHAPLECVNILKTHPVLAFSGIGRPKKFFDYLKVLGIKVAMERSFPDHHAFTQLQAKELLHEAELKGLTLVTTEKDFIRLPSDDASGSHLARLSQKSQILPVKAVFENMDGLKSLLNSFGKIHE